MRLSYAQLVFIFFPYLYVKVIISAYRMKDWGILSMIFGIFNVRNSLSSDNEQQDFPPVSSQSKIRLHGEATGFLPSFTLERVQSSTSLIYLLFWQVGSANFNTKPKLTESHMFRIAFYFLVFIAKNYFNFNGMWLFWRKLYTSSVIPSNLKSNSVHGTWELYPLCRRCHILQRTKNTKPGLMIVLELRVFVNSTNKLPKKWAKCLLFACMKWVQVLTCNSKSQNIKWVQKIILFTSVWLKLLPLSYGKNNTGSLF